MPPLSEAWLPAVDVQEDKNNVVVQAEIPGMKKEEFEVYLSGDDLVIAGERKSESEEKRAGMYRAEQYLAASIAGLRCRQPWTGVRSTPTIRTAS